MNETQRSQIAPLPRVAILGAGSMGGAILSGLRSPKVQIAEPITVTTQSQASAAAFDAAGDVAAFSAEVDELANKRAVEGASIVVLAVKPWAIHDVLRDIAETLEPGAIVVSVAAGITCASMEALVPDGVAVLRAMPNTPSHIGRGVTGISAGATATAAHTETVRHIFETVGSVLVVDEERIDAVSAVSGSGPAYLYFFAEQFIAAAERLGFSADEARLLAQGTVTGAAALLEQSGETPKELRLGVTTPNGTTEQAMHQLQAAGWGEAFDRALAAAIRRSAELAAGN